MITHKPTGTPLARADVEAAVRAVAADEPEIVAAYLFGSIAHGTSGPMSDVDVAVLFEDERREEPLGRVIDALSRRLRSSDINVIDLGRAPAGLRYRVFRDGRRLLCRDRGRVQRLTASTVREYLDLKPLRDRAFGVMRAAILGGA